MLPQVKGVAPFVGSDQLPAFVAVAAPFRDAYLAGCLGRLQDGINTTFAGGARGLPTTAEVQKCIVQLHEELKAAGASAQLGLQIGAVVRKAVRMLAERVEYMAAAGPELRQVPLGPAAGGGATPGQLRNIALCSQLQEVHRWGSQGTDCHCQHLMSPPLQPCVFCCCAAQRVHQKSGGFCHPAMQLHGRLHAPLAGH
jgi:hypothetical protein